MTDSGPDPGDVARYLRQQGEIGGGTVFLSGLTAAEVLELAAEGGRGGAEEGEEGPPSSSRASRTPRGGGPEYEKLEALAEGCRKCALSETRTHVVFADGNPGARLMVVGEAPGAREDETGKAFVGPAGKYLDLLLASVDLSRDDSVYICNVLKCRPPGNRNPLPEEIQSCTPYLRRQIELVAPQAILGVGTFAGQFLTEKSMPLGRLRGEVYSYEGVPVVVTYHPAALLRSSRYIGATWDDLQLLRQVMDGA